MPQAFDLKHDAYRIHWPADGDETPGITLNGADISPAEPFAASLIFSLANRIVEGETLLQQLLEERDPAVRVPPEWLLAVREFIEPGEITVLKPGERDHWLAENVVKILEVLGFAEDGITMRKAHADSNGYTSEQRDRARIHAVEEIAARYRILARGLARGSRSFRTGGLVYAADDDLTETRRRALPRRGEIVVMNHCDDCDRDTPRDFCPKCGKPFDSDDQRAAPEGELK